ncbi:MAG: hypothetical protein ACRC6S_03705 [Shewanella sp.]
MFQQSKVNYLNLALTCLALWSSSTLQAETPKLHMHVAAQTWQADGQWLENQYLFEPILQHIK